MYFVRAAQHLCKLNGFPVGQITETVFVLHVTNSGLIMGTEITNLKASPDVSLIPINFQTRVNLKSIDYQLCSFASSMYLISKTLNLKLQKHRQIYPV